MHTLRIASLCALIVNWLLFAGLLAWNHLRVRKERQSRGIPEERPSIRDSRSMTGLLVEGLAFVIAWSFPMVHFSSPRFVSSIVFGCVAVLVLQAALRHLGLEWRIKAVVTEDHNLITSGPYGIVRHPVFTALFCLLCANVLLLTNPIAGASSLFVYAAGTEMRIRAEDGLLQRRFGVKFQNYREAVKAWIPGVR